MRGKKGYFAKSGIVVFGIILVSMAFLTMNASAQSHDPVWIDENGDGSFDAGEWNGTSIQNAVDYATAGQAIYVENGTYYENVVINKSITLRANSSPVIDGMGDVGISVEANDAVVQDMNVTNCSIGINVHNSSFTVHNVTLSNNTVYDNSNNGICLYSSSNNTITNNTANSNNNSGILLWLSSNNTLTNNTANSNVCWNGIRLYTGSNNNTLTNNTANSNNNSGILLWLSSNNTLTNNTANSNVCWNGIRLYTGSNNNTLTNNTANSNNNSGILLWLSSNNTLTNNTANSNNWMGIRLYMNADNNTISNNTANSNNLTGIDIKSSSNNTIMSNNASNNKQDGIKFYGNSTYGYSTNNLITGNIANNNTWKGINLESNSNNNTITNNTASFNGALASSLVSGINLLTSNNNTITNNTVNNNTYFGVYIKSCSNNTFTNNTANNNSNDGIYLYSSSNNTLINNTVNNNSGSGAYLYNSSNNNITGNTISNNSDWGIYVYLSNNTILLENKFFNNSIFLDGNELSHYIHTIENNTVNGKPLYYYKNNNSGFIVPSDAGAIILVNCTNTTVRDDVNISYVDIGMEILYSQNITITNCSITNSTYGIYLVYSENSTIYENIFDDNAIAFSILNSSYNTINENTLKRNLLGISLLFNSNHSTISNNTLDGNLLGISLTFGSNNNTIVENQIQNNLWGLLIIESNYSTIYHNNFINSTIHATDNSTTVWYNASSHEGNYWDNYTGVDEDPEDGIGDTPYNITGGSNQDLYPLMHYFELYYILNISAPLQVNEDTAFTVTVKSNGGTTIQGVNVTFNGQTPQITNSNGQVTFTAPSVSSDTSYEINATKNGYTGDSTTITVKNVPPGNGGNGYVPPSGDTTAPTAPTNVSCTTPENDSTPSFSWNASTDASGIAGYYVKIDNGTDTWVGNMLVWNSTSSIEDGNHTFYVKAKDASSNGNTGNYGSCLFTINTTGGIPPVADANGPYTGLTYQNITFDSSDSYDSDGTIVNYTWSFGDETAGYGINPTHAYTTAGEFTVNHTVTDNHGLTNTTTTTANITLDTDGDGYSDDMETSYGTNATNATDYPTDTDGDGTPDEDSPDEKYTGDTDDDNDGLSDGVENAVGSNSKDPENKTIFVEVSISGLTHYLVGINNDGTYDIFYSSATSITTATTINADGKYLIDYNGDGTIDYIYDPATAQVTPYEPEEEFPWTIMLIGIVIVAIIILIIWSLFKTGYLYIEEEPTEEEKLEQKPKKKEPVKKTTKKSTKSKKKK